MPNKSFFINLTNMMLNGVKITKYIKPIIIGAIKEPNIKPNLIQILLSGDKSLEFNKPKTKKTNEVLKK